MRSAAIKRPAAADVKEAPMRPKVLFLLRPVVLPTRKAVMKKLMALGIAMGCLLFPAIGRAAVTLDFEGLKDEELVVQFYNGGAGSEGSVGPDYCIGFNADARALIDSDAGGTGRFANEPSPDTVMYVGSGGDIGNGRVIMN